MPTIMDHMRSKVNTLSVGHFKEQLNNVKRVHDLLLKDYQRKLQEIDILEIQQKTALDAAKKELKELFEKLKKQEKIYINLDKKLTSLEDGGVRKRRKRKTKIHKFKKTYRKKTRKKII